MGAAPRQLGGWWSTRKDEGRPDGRVLGTAFSFKVSHCECDKLLNGKKHRGWAGWVPGRNALQMRRTGCLLYQQPAGQKKKTYLKTVGFAI